MCTYICGLSVCCRREPTKLDHDVYLAVRGAPCLTVSNYPRMVDWISRIEGFSEHAQKRLEWVLDAIYSAQSCTYIWYSDCSVFATKHIHTHAHTHARTHARTHTHTHTHTQLEDSSLHYEAATSIRLWWRRPEGHTRQPSPGHQSPSLPPPSTFHPPLSTLTSSQIPHTETSLLSATPEPQCPQHSIKTAQILISTKTSTAYLIRHTLSRLRPPSETTIPLTVCHDG